MRRFFTYKSLLTLIPLAAIAFVVPHMAHANAYLPDWMDTGSSIIGNVLSSFMEVFVMPLAAGVLYLSGMLLDSAIKFSLHTAYIFSLSPAINLGWTIIRDLCNIFFIFILIWISLGTIVSGLRFGTSTMLKNVVIAAILINFSLFITKAVIDVSNIFGNWLYTGVEQTLAAGSGNTSLSGLIVTRMHLDTLWTNPANISNASDPTQTFTGRMLRLAVTVIAIYIFIYAAVLFLARSIELLFLLIFSPIGFMGKILPQIEDYAKEWRKELTSVAMFPLVFLIMLYLSLQFINSIDALGTAFTTATGAGGAALPVPGSSFTVAQYFDYFIIIFLLHATLRISRRYSGEMGEKLGGMAEGLGKLAVNAIGTYATGGAALALRAGGRGLGAALSTEGGMSERFAAFKKTGKENLPPILTNPKILQYVKDSIRNPAKPLKDTGTAITNKMKSGTWDVRNLPTGQGSVGDLLTSTVGNALESKGIELKALDSKSLKAQQAEWIEEKKIEEANTAILKDIDTVLDVVAKNLGLNDLKRRAEAAGATLGDKTAYTSAIKLFNDNNAVKDAKIRISDQVQKLGNKQLEKLNKKILKNDEFVRTISQAQAENLAEKAENDEDKAKIWGARLSDVTVAIKNNAISPEIKKAIKGHSDKELENLPAEILKKQDFVRPENMDYDKFDKLMKSNKLTNATKSVMRNERYRTLDEAIANNNTAVIDDQFDHMDEAEIAKLGWKKDGVVGTRLSNPNVIQRLTPKVLGKLFDELSESERNDIKTELNRVVPLPTATGTNRFDKNLQNVQKWFGENPIGKQF